MDYALNQRQALHRYLEDGRLKPDNNIAENAIRPLALGRKNWLFAASERGARATALFLGLIQSCKACRINPWEYSERPAPSHYESPGQPSPGAFARSVEAPSQE